MKNNFQSLIVDDTFLNEVTLSENTKNQGGDDKINCIFPPLENPPYSANGEIVLSFNSQNKGAWDIAWAQIIGEKHRLSEDSLGFSLRPVATSVGAPSQAELQRGEFIIADGVGGGARGDIASHALVQHCLQASVDQLDLTVSRTIDKSHLKFVIEQADDAVNKAISEFTSLPGASTLCAAWFNCNGAGWVTRVGDSRINIYDSSNHHFYSVLADQTYANLGETPSSIHDLHAPARMIGAGLVGEVEIFPFQIKLGEILILSTDGFHNWIDPQEISEIFKTSTTISELAKNLVLKARFNGSYDDISVLLVKINF